LTAVGEAHARRFSESISLRSDRLQWCSFLGHASAAQAGVFRIFGKRLALGIVKQKFGSLAVMRESNRRRRGGFLTSRRAPN
jgi:hypothetical protein